MSGALLAKIVMLVLYFAGLFWIGWAASRQVKTMEDYFVAGKKLNFWLVSFSSRATGESGWLLLGLSGMGFVMGIHSFWIVLGEVMGVAICWMFLNQRFKELTDMYDCVTVTDYLADRLGDKRHVVRGIATLALLIFITAYISAQFAACGKAFTGFLGMEHQYGVYLGLVIVAFYTVAGGFVAVVWSDFVQGSLMLLGLISIPAAAVIAAGGFTPVVSALQGADPALLDVWGKTGWGFKGALSAAGLTAIGLGFLGSPQLFVRFISVKNRQELTKGSMVAVAFTAISGVGAVLAGMAGRALIEPGGALASSRDLLLKDSEQVLPMIATELFPVIVTGLIIAVVLAAIMSTADSLLVLVSSAVVRDTLQKIFWPDLTQQRLTLLSRLVTFGVCLVALLFALDPKSQIFWFVLFAWTGITSAFCPVIILSLYWKRLTAAGGAAAMLTGIGLTILWKVIPLSWVSFVADWALSMKIVATTKKATLHSVVDHMLIAFFGALLTAVVVSWFTKPPEHAEKDMEKLEATVIDMWDRR